MAAGKRLRTTVPRASLAEYKTQKTRKDPVAILETQAKTRLQDLIPVRYARMLTSPFAFLRGTAAVMAQDLSPSPVTGLQVQVCGDMHVSNFGVFASAERSLVFGINDFDETIPGPWEWDLKRLATSAVVAGQFVGKDRNDCEAYSRAVVSSYRQRYSRIRRNGLSRHMVFSHSRGGRIGLGSAKAAATSGKKGIAKAKKGSHLQVLEKMTDLIDNKQRIVENAPFVVRETKTEAGMPIREAVGLFLEQYLSSLYDGSKTIDFALPGAGRSPKGRRRRQRRNTVLDRVHARQRRRRSSLPAIQGSRGVRTRALPEGPHIPEPGPTRSLRTALDPGLPGHSSGMGTPQQNAFLRPSASRHERQLRVRSADHNHKGMEVYCGLCGWALALAHAKSGDAATIAGYLGKTDEIDDALTKFAFAYSEQNDRDYDELKKAARDKTY